VTVTARGAARADVRREALMLEVLRASAGQMTNLPKLGLAFHAARLPAPGLKAWLAARPALVRVRPRSPSSRLPWCPRARALRRPAS